MTLAVRHPQTGADQAVLCAGISTPRATHLHVALRAGGPALQLTWP